jgi:hypothetical protein
MDPFENEKTTKLLIRLKRQEILLESFKNHINKILKEIRKGECNFLLINQLSQFIVYYYKKNLISLDDELNEESDKEETEESDKDKSDKDKSDKEESDKDKSDKEESDKEESDKEESNKDKSDKEESDDDKSIKENQDTLFNHFMNNSNLKKKSLFNPNYDIDENIKIFIRNSLIY